MAFYFKKDNLPGSISFSKNKTEGWLREYGKAAS